jgi:hypothetical protein
MNIVSEPQKVSWRNKKVSWRNKKVSWRNQDLFNRRDHRAALRAQNVKNATEEA